MKPESISYTLMKLKDPTEGGKKKESNQDLRFVEDSDREKRVQDTKTKKDSMKWEKYEPVILQTGQVKSVCTFDTKFVYQNDLLEKRYKEFKKERDYYLLDEVPEKLTFEYKFEHQNGKAD